MGMKVRKNCCWIKLIDYDELTVLIREMRREGFEGKIISVEWKDLPRLGKRMKVTIQQPGTTPSSQVSYLRFDNYKKWNRIKRTVYAFRKLKEVC